MTYFICSTPGTLGNFVGRSVKALLSDDNAELLINPLDHQDPNILTSDQLTADYFYNNIQVPDNGTFVINSPFRPNYEILKQRFPECKIIVISHMVQEIQHISRSLFRHYYVESYEITSAPFFNKLINDHSWLFSGTNLTPDQLTRIDKEIFVKILAHQILLAGFHCLTVPANPDVLEIKFDKIFYHVDEVEAQLESFTGKTFIESDKKINRDLTQEFIKKYFSLLAY